MAADFRLFRGHVPVGSAMCLRSLVANAMQDMQQTTFPIERSLTRVESWSLYHRLAIVRRPSNQRHIVIAMTAPALPAPLWPPKWTLRNCLICPTHKRISAPAKQVTNQGTHNASCCLLIAQIGELAGVAQGLE
jgi:hypothetical protein